MRFSYSITRELFDLLKWKTECDIDFEPPRVPAGQVKPYVLLGH